MTLHDQQLKTARELGYGEDVVTLNREHDLLHLDLCDWLKIPSWSMVAAARVQLTPDQQRLAECEEAATLAVQKLMRAHGAGLPRDRSGAGQ